MHEITTIIITLIPEIIQEMQEMTCQLVVPEVLLLNHRLNAKMEKREFN